ncbi:MAG: MFS transporter [Patescibacteria group bacterium]|nr:MFS transporter [Patescibacteria group bacterium]
MPKILKNYQFLRLWGNQVLLQVAFNMSNFTALLILADRTHSPFIQALFYTALTLPAFVFGLIAGPVVDMTERKRLMLITDLLLAVLFFSYIFADGKVLFLLIIAALTSAVARFFIPAEAATIPLVVDKKNLHHANSFFLFTLMGSVLLGYAIAGPIIQLFGGLRSGGEMAPFILSSIFLAIGFVLRLSLKKIEITKPYVLEDSIVGKTFILLWQTVKEVRVNRRVSLPILLLVFIELVVGVLSVVFLEYVRRYLELPLTSITYVLMGPLVLGLILGVVFLGKIDRIYGYRKSILASLVCIGFVLFTLGVIPIFFAKFSSGFILVRVISLIASFLMGVLMVIIAVQSRTVLQTATPQEMQGRIFSFLDIMIAFVTPIPVLTLGLLADKVSLLATLMLIGAVVVLTTFIGYKLLAARKNSGG